MNFINPIEILDLQKDDISDIDNIIIKKAKRKVLAEIELSDDAHLSYKGHKINRSEIDKAINELDKKELIEFYHFIANNSELNYFLTTGNESIFLSFKQQSIYKLPNFINFISPYFAQNYDLALYKSFRENNETLFQKIITVKPLVKESDLENCYKKVLNTLRDNINEIDKITTTVKNVEINFDEDDIEDAFEITRDKLNVNIINHLPRQFQSIRNKCANSIRNLSVNIFNSYDDSDLALDIISYALEFNIDGLTEKNLQNDYDTINNIKIEREEQKVNAPVLKKYASLLVEFKNKLKSFENKEIPVYSLQTWINENINVKEINSLNEVFNEIRNSIAIALRELSISCWNINNDINSSLIFMNISLNINTTQEVKLRLLKDKNELDSLNQKYSEYINCWFCKKNKAQDSCSVPITVYKEISRGGLLTRNVQYSYKEINIPRCDSCKEIHNDGKNKLILSILSCIILVSIILLLIDDKSNPILYSIVIGGIIGTILGKYLEHKEYKNRNILGNSFSGYSDFSVLNEHLRIGWTLNQPKA